MQVCVGSCQLMNANAECMDFTNTKLILRSASLSATVQHQNMPMCCSHSMQRSRNEAEGASCQHMLPVKHASQDLSGHHHAGCIWSYRNISCHQSNVFIKLITQFPKFLVAQCLQLANTASDSTPQIRPCTDVDIHACETLRAC